MKKEDPWPSPVETLAGEKVVCDAVYLTGRETTVIRHAKEAFVPLRVLGLFFLLLVEHKLHAT